MQLSKRILFYCKDKIIWRCTECWKREDTLGRFNLAFTPQSRSLHDGRKEVLSHKRRKPNLLHNTNWYYLLEEYSRKQLTYQSDKLPALSAVAQEIHSMTNDSYIAGLWNGDIVNGLLWQKALGSRDHQLEQAREFVFLEDTKTPSWSWAAYDGSIDNYSWSETEDQEELATIEDARAKLVDKSYPTG